MMIAVVQLLAINLWPDSANRQRHAELVSRQNQHFDFAPNKSGSSIQDNRQTLSTMTYKGRATRYSKSLKAKKALGLVKRSVE